jgi:hypothetical protein
MYVNAAHLGPDGLAAAGCGLVHALLESTDRCQLRRGHRRVA